MKFKRKSNVGMGSLNEFFFFISISIFGKIVHKFSSCSAFFVCNC